MDVYLQIAKLLKENNDYLIITDSDQDGVSAGIIAKIILDKLKKDYSLVVRDHKSLTLKKYTKGHYKTLLILDSPFKDEDLITFAEENKDRVIIYIDHHKRNVPSDLPSNLYYYDIRALGEKEIISIGEVMYRVGIKLFGLSFKKYCLIAMMSAIGDWLISNSLIKDFQDTHKNLILKESVPAYPIYILFTLFTFAKRNDLINYGELLIEDPIKFFSEIDQNVVAKKIKSFFNKFKTIKTLYKDDKLLVFKVKGSVSTLASFISSFYKNKILIFVSKAHDTIIDKIIERKYKISIRSSIESIDVGKIMEEFVSKYGINGGGHPQAAGGKIWKKDLEKLISFFKEKI